MEVVASDSRFLYSLHPAKKKKRFLRKEYATLFLYSAFVARRQADSQAKLDTDRASRKGQRHHRKTPDVAGAAHD